ncbi:MAG: glycosyltransferase [Rhodospirillaceae bacterium]
MNQFARKDSEPTPLRVLVVTNMYPTPDKPGYGSFVKTQVDSLVAKGVDVEVLSIPGYKSKLHYLLAMGRVFWRTTFGHFDLVHAHYGLSGLAARAQFKVPLVVSFCGDDLYGHADATGKPTRSSLFWVWCHKKLAGMVDGVICKSAAMRRLLPGQPGKVIPNGLDFNHFRPLPRAECRRALGLDQDTVYVLFPYSPDRVRKNFAGAQEAVRLAAARTGRPVELLITQGEPNQTMPLYMNAADALILASYWEGSPNAVKEAMACNLAVVSVAVGDVPELLADVPGNHVVERTPEALAEGLCRVIEDGPARTEARAAIGRLRLERVADQVLDVYYQVLMRSQRERPAPRPHKGRRILIIVENLPVPFDRRVWTEATSLRDDGYDVTVICPATPRYPQRYEVLDGIVIHRHPLPPERGGFLGYVTEYAAALFWQSWLTLKVARGPGFDVIQACNPPDLIFLVALPYRLLGKRFVFDQHDLWPHLYEIKFGRRGAVHAVLRLCQRLTFALADRSIATNESFKQLAVQAGGMEPQHVHVVRSCPDLGKFIPAEPIGELRPPGCVVAGYLGVMAEQDGVHNLLLAAHHAIVEQGRADLRVLIVGDGPARQDMEALARELGIAGEVRFVGFRVGEDMRRHLSSCDFFVAPDESNAMNDLLTMNKIMEYMAMGKPIVMFDLPEGRNIAGDAALYAADNDPRDMAMQMTRLMDDAELRSAMGAYGQARVHREFSWEKERERLMTCYDGLFASMGRPVFRPAPQASVLANVPSDFTPTDTADAQIAMMARLRVSAPARAAE